MTIDASFWHAGGAVFKLFRQRRETFVGLEEQACLPDCGLDAQSRIRRLALEELGKAGLIGHTLDRLQQAEIGLRVSRRLLMEDTEGEQSS